MLRSLRTAALGMAAQQLNVDAIANNLANVNTTGYKKSTVEFQDLLYETINTGSAEGAQGREKPSEINIGLGNKPISTFRSYSQGAIEATNNPLDMAISGKGFFQVMMPDGSITYSRDGAFRINSTGEMVNSAGLKMYPNISLPDGVQSVNIAQNGVVAALIDGEVTPLEIGQIELANFMNPAGLKPIGGNLLEASEASGDPSYGMAGDQGFGTVMQGYLEKSNGDVVKEMINLIVAQRSYEINSKAVKTADEMLAMTNALKR
ncbi:MAG: flagellar basal-body rod protein FlgG [Candidatus Marinimicrobia bacterium]|nr:flagellar basal-body rod protein FlgG [Candidatus Neomarinimicrobiota bacterium]